MTSGQRIGEIDLFRGLAILLMVIFHTVVDLQDFFHIDLDYRSGIWYFVGRSSAILFMLLAGISSQFSRSNLRRGLQVLAAGLLVTGATYCFLPDAYVRFGILQLLGCSMLLQPLAARLSVFAQLLLALLVLVAGPSVAVLNTDTSLLLPLGLMPPGFRSIDYYPLLPWYGVFLLGAAGGRLIYANRRSRLPFSLSENPLNWLGRHSLTIYLLHQPLLLVMLNIFFILLPF
ncbi:MAG TPA: heparan-alpha-glucosaminide N-acetyltransferase [Patescibacteria group bacterium]|nr:heparan-alpha-glucosaminide N-acetyltransferase [Patescibacteria group bacterium]